MTVIFRGRPACECLAAWLPAYEAELLRRGVIKHNIDIYQLVGTAKASAGTHMPGGAYDVAQVSSVAILVAREMGAAAFHRPPNWDGRNGGEHQHGVLRGCPHNAGGRYQIAALEAGYNGLGHLGRGGRDVDPRPKTWRTWQQGIAWAKVQALPVETVNVVVANVKSNPVMSQPHVEADMRKIIALRPNVVLGAEIEPERYKDAWRKIVGDKSFGLLHECPIWLGPRWRVASQSVKRRVLGFPRVSPNRWDTVVEAQRPGGYPLAFIAMHTYSEKDNPRATMRRLRVNRWSRHIARTTADIQALNARGVSVIVGGDLNDHGGPTRFTSTQINFLNEGLMQLTLCPAPGKTGRLLGVHRLRGFTDHPIVSARIEIRTKA